MKFGYGCFPLLLATFLLSFSAILAGPSSLEHDSSSEEDILGVGDQTTTRDFDHSTRLRLHEGHRRKLLSSTSTLSSDELRDEFPLSGETTSHDFDPVTPRGQEKSTTQPPQLSSAVLNGRCAPFCTFHWRRGSCVCHAPPTTPTYILKTTTSMPAVTNEDDN